MLFIFRTRQTDMFCIYPVSGPLSWLFLLFYIDTVRYQQLLEIGRPKPQLAQQTKDIDTIVS